MRTIIYLGLIWLLALAAPIAAQDFDECSSPSADLAFGADVSDEITVDDSVTVGLLTVSSEISALRFSSLFKS